MPQDNATHLARPEIDQPPSLVRLADALAYLRALDRIEGWLSLATAIGMMELIWQQERDGVRGGLAEIGIHHGKSFLALATAARPGERLVAIDLFEHQALNVDNSGAGSRAAFEGHLAAFCPSAEVAILACSSVELRGREAEHGLREIRFFSIDGGHTKALTINDLQVADACLVEGGICCLDDILSHLWTGVLSGAAAFLGPDARLVPLAIFPNKLFLCRPSHVARYRAWLASAFAPTLERRDAELFDWRVDVFGSGVARIGSIFAAIDEVAERALSAQAEAAPSKREAEYAADIGAARAEIRALRGSWSWRLTRPLRVIARRVYAAAR